MSLLVVVGIVELDLLNLLVNQWDNLLSCGLMLNS